MSGPAAAPGQLIAAVRVLHNEAGVSQGHWDSVTSGYKPESAELREVWQVRLSVPLLANENISDALPRVCERIWELTNADPDMLAEEEQAQALDYRAARVRSLSIGDVVILRAGDIEQAFAVEPTSWRQIETPAAASIAQAGSRPVFLGVNGSNPK